MALKYQQSTECLDFLNDIINTSEKKIRSPYLARLELLKRTCTGEDLQYSLQSVDLMHQYFSQFGEKACVVSDLRLYLNLLTPKGKLELLEKVRKRNKIFLRHKYDYICSFNIFFISHISRRVHISTQSSIFCFLD